MKSVLSHKVKLGTGRPSKDCTLVHLDWLRLPLVIFGMQNLSFILLSNIYNAGHLLGFLCALSVLGFASFLLGGQYRSNGSLISPVIISLLLMLAWLNLWIIFPYVPIAALPFTLDPMLHYTQAISVILIILFAIGSRIQFKRCLLKGVYVSIVGILIFVAAICAVFVLLGDNRNLGLDEGVQKFEYCDIEFADVIARERGDGTIWRYATKRYEREVLTYRQALDTVRFFARTGNFDVFVDVEHDVWLVVVYDENLFERNEWLSIMSDENLFNTYNLMFRGSDGKILAEWFTE